MCAWVYISTQLSAMGKWEHQVRLGRQGSSLFLLALAHSVRHFYINELWWINMNTCIYLLHSRATSDNLYWIQIRRECDVFALRLTANGKWIPFSQRTPIWWQRCACVPRWERMDVRKRVMPFHIVNRTPSWRRPIEMFICKSFRLNEMVFMSMARYMGWWFHGWQID